MNKLFRVKAFMRRKGVNYILFRKYAYRFFHLLSWVQAKSSIYVIYTCGKVGSQTLYHTLQNNLLESNVYHVHFLSKKWLTRTEMLPSKRKTGLFKSATEINGILETSNKDLRVISIVRDPVSKALSQIFQTPHAFGLTNDELNLLSVSDICRLLVEDFPEQLFQPTYWFDDEFFEFTGIDVYDGYFNHEQKKQEISLGRFNVLIIRTEDFKLEETLLKNLSHFVNKPINTLTVHNKTSAKPTGDLFKTVKAHIKFPEELLEQIYSSRYCQHFYSQSEIKNFKLRWQA